MAFVPPIIQPQFADLIGILAQARNTDEATYQTIQVLIERLSKFRDYIDANLTSINALIASQGGVGPQGPQGPPGVIGPHHITHETGGTDAVLSLDGGTITSGTVADARLSANVALRNSPNNFSADQFIIKPGPTMRFQDNALPANQKLWVFGNDSGTTFVIQARNDVGGIVSQIIIDRTGVITANGLGSTPLDASQLTGGTVPVARLPATVAYTNINNVFIADQIIQKNLPTLVLFDTTEPVDSRIFRITNVSQLLYIQAVNDTISSSPGYITLDRVGQMTVSGPIRERGRATPLGEWSALSPVLAADAGTVTLTSNNGCQYTLIGKTMMISFYLVISLSSTPNVVTLAYPTGFISNGVYGAAPFGLDDTTGVMQLIPGGAVINLYINSTVPVWATGSHIIYGVAIIPIA